jgi:pantoate--beta-alanine ligase
MRERIKQEPDAVVDYISLVDPETLVELDRVTDSAVAALAVRIGKTRLIDNMMFQGKSVSGCTT